MYPQSKLKTFIRPQYVIWISQICKYAQLDSWSSQNASAWEKCFKVEKAYLQNLMEKCVYNINTKSITSRRLLWF